MARLYILSAAFTFFAIFLFAVLDTFFQNHVSVYLAHACAAIVGFVLMSLPAHHVVKRMGGVSDALV
jgi:hypothetical protein